MRRTHLQLRPVWRPHDPAIRMIVRLSGWTFGFVLANQIALFVVLALEFHVGPGAVSAYTYAYAFFQFPFAVVATSIINVASPDLARLRTARRWPELGNRFGGALRQVLALILPATVGYLILARQAVTLLLQHGNEGAGAAHLTASVLALFALGLPGFCVFFLATRTFQAMQDTRSAFVLYVLENGLNILVAVLLYRPLGVRGLALSYSVAYTIAALAALVGAARTARHNRRQVTLDLVCPLARLEPGHGVRRRRRRGGDRHRLRDRRLDPPPLGGGGRRGRLPRGCRCRSYPPRLADFPPGRASSFGTRKGRP